MKRSIMPVCLVLALISAGSSLANNSPWYFDAGYDTTKQTNVTIQSSSTQNKNGLSDYGVRNLTTYNYAWCEGAPGDGLGEYVEWRFSPPVKHSVSPFKSVKIIPGITDSDSAYGNNGRPQMLQLTLSDGTLQDIMVPDTRYGQNEFTITRKRTKDSVSWARLTIKSAYSGRRYQDTCIAYVEFR